MKRVLIAALLAGLAACGTQNAGDGGEGVAAVQPSRVTPEALRAAASDERLQHFYEARGWQPAWNADNAKALVEAIGGARRHGLDPRAFLADAERSADPARREAALSLAALSYGGALAHGLVDPKRLREVYTVPRPDPNLIAGLNQALAQGTVGDWLNGLAPQDAEYRALSEAYVRANQDAARQQQRSPVENGDTISPGDSDPRLPQIAAELRADGYLARPQSRQGDEAAKQTKAATPSERYGDDIVAAVRRLQEDYGLTPDGKIDSATLAALNGGALERARTLAVNLERRRWLERNPPATRIDVNTAAATLAYWRDGNVVDARPVIVGQPGWETPQLGSPIFQLVANPTWTVPQSIEEEELASKGPAYFERNNMVRRDGRIVQLPGPDNSLGLVKFDMRNDQAIYLHDTPAKSLFDQDERHRSHGCVRVRDALGFAQMIAQQEGVLDEWQRARATGEETFVDLPREIPVRLMYHTAFVDGGRVRFRNDVYGWDDDIAEALGMAVRARRTPPEYIGDIGP